MPVIRLHRIYRQDLRANPTVLFLFGDNELRVGLGGQAGEMRGEPNAIGVRTKTSPGGVGEFWSDDGLHRQMIDEDLAPAFQHMQTGGIVVVPLDGLGTGLAQLDKRAPKTFAYLTEQLDRLAKTEAI